MFSAKLTRLRQLVWLREELRDLSNRAYYWIRRIVLQLAAERGLGEDIFQLTYKDILQNDQSNLETNRDAFLAFRNCPAPPEIRSASSDPTFNRSPTPSHGMAGLGVSPGTITGRAHVVNSLREAFPIEPGSILVCRFIEPSWVPVLDHVVAVVAESGGVLSHAAVIAREYGIPAVLGVAGATRDIQTGDYLQVQGDRGIVEKLSGKISGLSASIQTNQVSSPSCLD
jgi:pyruvate,water dikinase